MSILPALLAVCGGEPLTLEISQSSLSGSDDGFGLCSPAPVSTSSSTTVTASGGKAPYTYAWTLSGGAADGGPFTPSNVNGASTAFSDTRCDNHINNTEVWLCTVTDDLGAQKSISCTVTLTWADLS